MESSRRDDRSQPSCTRCESCKVPAANFFCGLSVEEFRELGLRRRCRSYRKRDAVFREGESATRLYCVLSGWVKIWKMTAEGHRQIVRWAGPGDPLGYRSVMSGEHYRASATAATRTVICHLEGQDLKLLLARQPVLAQRLIARLSQDLGLAEERLLQVAHQPVRQRLAQLLLQLEDDSSNGFRMTRLDMAQIIGTSPETLVRLLTEYHELGVLRRTRKGFEVLEREELERLAGLEPTC